MLANFQHFNGKVFFYWIMAHSRKWEEAHLHSCLCLLPHKVAPIECTNHCAFNKHDAQVPAVLDMRAISTRPLAWSSVHCGYRRRGWRDGGKKEMRDGGRRGISEYWWWQNQTGGWIFRWTRCLNMYPPSLWSHNSCQNIKMSKVAADTRLGGYFENKNSKFPGLCREKYE